MAVSFLCELMLALLILSVLPLLTLSSWTHHIYVNQTGKDTDACWINGSQAPCASLNFALMGFSNSTIIYLSSGHHMLQQGNETAVKNKSNVAIIGIPGEGQDTVTITCAPLAGLSFHNCENFTILSLSLIKCGANHTSSSMSSDRPLYLHFQVALYVVFCRTLKMVDVTIERSNGTGMTIYSTMGEVIITKCTFSNNTIATNVNHGGGGLQIEWIYCDPVYTNCLKRWQYVPAIYTISECTFTANYAKGDPFSFYNFLNQRNETYVLGRGGGLSIVFKDIANTNRVLVNSSVIEDNSASFGGGFYVAYYDTALNNSVIFTNVSVVGNRNIMMQNLSVLVDLESGGGGIVEHLPQCTSSNGICSNSLELMKCNFTNNSGAHIGGGLSVGMRSPLNVSLNDICFIQNHALLGSALYLNSYSFFAGTMHVSIKNINFTSNYLRGPHQQLIVKSQSATLYSSGIPISFEGNNTFISNDGSALELHVTSVVIAPGTIMRFEKNTASYGGAIALFDCSFIVLHNATELSFINNSAAMKGGAIFVGLCSANPQPIQPSQCFIRYYEGSVHPDQWKTNLTFIDNKVRNMGFVRNAHSNSIYAQSLVSCWWAPKSSELTRPTIRKTLCWKTWHYNDSNCTANIQSEFAYINNTNQIKVEPGGRLILMVCDGNGETITLSAKMKFCTKNSSFGFSPYHTANSNCVTDVEPILYQYCPRSACDIYNQSFDVSVEVLTNDQSLESNIKVSLNNCQLPFKPSVNGPSNSESFVLSCAMPFDGFCCSNDCFKLTYDTCESGSVYTGTLMGYCLSYDDLNHVVFGRCPFSYYNYYDNFTGTYNDLIEHVRSSSSPLSAGRLNGYCKTSKYSSGSFDVSKSGLIADTIAFACTDCEYAWHPIVFFLVELIAVTLLVAIIFIFNIQLTSGLLNGYIFFIQVVPYYFNGPIPSFTLNLINVLLQIPNRIGSLNFVPKLCFSSNYGSLYAIASWLIIQAYMLLLLLILYCWVLWYNKGIKPIVLISRPFHRFLAHIWRITGIDPSLSHSIASVYVLCFVLIMTTSLRLLFFTVWYDLTDDTRWGVVFYYDGTLDYFGYPHAFFGGLAILILIIFIFIPTMYLLLYPFKWFQKALNYSRLNRQFLVRVTDDYNGPFRNSCDGSKRDYRYFSGLYLLLRIVMVGPTIYMYYQYYLIWVVFKLAVISVTAGCIMIFRPYRKLRHNFFDFLLFVNLGVLHVVFLWYVHFKDGLASVTDKFNIYGAFSEYICWYLPTGFLITYFLYWLVKRAFIIAFKVFKCKRRIKDSEDERRDSLPDRIVHPEDYDKQHAPVSVPAASYDFSSALLSSQNATYGSINTRTVTLTNDKPLRNVSQ